MLVQVMVRLMLPLQAACASNGFMPTGERVVLERDLREYAAAARSKSSASSWLSSWSSTSPELSSSCPSIQGERAGGDPHGLEEGQVAADALGALHARGLHRVVLEQRADGLPRHVAVGGAGGGFEFAEARAVDREPGSVEEIEDP